MLDDTPSHGELLLARDAVTPSARTALAQSASRGDLVRVARGAYLPAARWGELDAASRYRIFLTAIASTAREPLVFARTAAAALWRLPRVGRWPAAADVIAQPGGTARSTRTIRRHVEPSGGVVEIDGLYATSLDRTVIDIAREGDLERAVVVADAALNAETRGALALPAERPDLVAAAGRVPPFHGSARAMFVAAFADHRAGSPGESVSRVTLHRIGLPAPELQKRFDRSGRGSWFVDFWWPEFDMVGEFDGRGKYLDPGLRNDRTAAQVVYDEKLREDELRRQVGAFARWGWAEARSPERLLARLRESGLPREFASARRLRKR